MKTSVLVVMAVGACKLDSTLPATDDGPVDDAATDTGQLACDPMKPFDPPTLLDGFNNGGFNTAQEEFAVRFTADLNTAFVSTNGLTGNFNIHVFQRTSPTTFGLPIELDVLSTINIESGASVTGDGQTLYFHSTRPGSSGTSDLYVATRPTPTADFGNIARVANLNNSGAEDSPYATPDGSAIYFNRDSQLRFSRRTSGAFEIDQAVPGIDSTDDELFPVVTPDENTIFFSRRSAGDNTTADIYIARRSSPTASFDSPEPLTELNSPGFFDAPTWVTADGCTLFLISNRPPSQSVDVWVASRPL